MRTRRSFASSAHERFLGDWVPAATLLISLLCISFPCSLNAANQASLKKEPNVEASSVLGSCNGALSTRNNTCRESQLVANKYAQDELSVGS